MTEKEAIKKIEAVVKYAAQRGIHLTPNERTAFDMAISALSEQKSLKERMEQLYLEESLKEDLENLIKENERLRNALSENKGECISIDDVMSVFDDFMCGEVDEDGTATFLEMLKDKAESEGV